MAKMTYTEQLKHPHWQRKRLEMLEAAGWSCSCCGAKEQTLHVHHKRYVKGRMAWEYSDDELAVLCEGCHQEEHDARDLLDRLLTESCDAFVLHTAVGMLAGYLDAQCSINNELADKACRLDGHSYDLGVLASIAAGANWRQMSAAVQALGRSSFTPSERAAISRWGKEE